MVAIVQHRQRQLAQLPVVKPRVSLRTEEEEEDVESLFSHGPCHGQHERPAAEGTVKVEGREGRELNAGNA